MAKSQFLSTEIMTVRFPPFISTATGQYIIGTDAVTLYYLPPGGVIANVPMVWSAAIEMWTYDFAVLSYIQGTWMFRAESNDANMLEQWKVLVWGDYVDNIPLTYTRIGAPVGASISADIASAYARMGAPAGASMSADTAAVFARLGAPVGVSMSADIASAYARMGAPAGASMSADTAAIFARLGAPAGVSMSADIAAAYARMGAPAGVSMSADIAAVFARLGAPAGVSMSADVAAITALCTNLRKVTTNRWKVDTVLNTYTIYDDGGVLPLYVFNVFDETGAANAYKIFERVP